MVKEKKMFNIGDLVFAKVKGYPPWPAKLTKYNNKKFNVYFYGTGETANVKLDDIFPYVESKEKFYIERNMKRANFRQAAEQIEAALLGNDIAAPISMDTLSLTTGSNTDTTENVPKLPNSLPPEKEPLQKKIHEVAVSSAPSTLIYETPKSDKNIVTNSQNRSQKAKTSRTSKKKTPASKGKKANLNNTVPLMKAAQVSGEDEDNEDNEYMTPHEESFVPDSASAGIDDGVEQVQKITESADGPISDKNTTEINVGRQRRQNLKQKRRLIEELDATPPPSKRRTLSAKGINIPLFVTLLLYKYHIFY